MHMFLLILILILVLTLILILKNKYTYVRTYTLHYTTLHYITLPQHTYISCIYTCKCDQSIYIYIYMIMCVCLCVCDIGCQRQIYFMHLYAKHVSHQKQSHCRAFLCSSCFRLIASCLSCLGGRHRFASIHTFKSVQQCSRHSRHFKSDFSLTKLV